MKKIFTLIALCVSVIGMQAQDTWTVAGSATICGSEWNINDEANNMTKNNNGLWELKKEGCVLEKDAENKFKVVKNHSWDEAYPGSDYVLKVDETATYTVTITFDESTKAVNATAEKTGSAVIGEKTWTVAGEEGLTGYNWKPEETANDMEKQSDGTYKKVFAGRTLAAQTYKFKVCANHGWSEAYPGSDYELKIETAGTYDVTITFNPDTKAVNATATAATSSEKVYSVAGDIALLACNWDPAQNIMTKQADGTYQYEIANRPLYTGATYMFKMCADLGWAESYPNENGANFELTVEEDGIFTVTFTFDPATSIGSAVATKTGDAMVWTVVGNQEWMGNWEITSTDGNMKKQDDGTFKKVFTNVALTAATSYEFKLCGNHTWDPAYPSSNYSFTVDNDDNYDVTITLNVVSMEVSHSADVATGISTVKRESFTVNQYYDLQGRRVAQPTKGLYIVNGKKIMLK